ncbi:MAG: hypothetical protein NWF07_14310, partial [Candidatus Bathyarchaeota archaeon]|nr:hypothetical protein [Candidatus Bathyarchaeota archaeon]
VLVLVGSVAFAGFTGSATAEFGVNLDNAQYGFTNDTSVSIDVELMEALGEAVGEGDIYADISASLTFSFSNADEGNLGGAAPWTIDADEALVPLYVTFDFDHAKIVGEDWYVGILGALGAPNFATSAIDEWEEPAPGANDWGYTVDEATYMADFESTVSDEPGLEIGYMGYTLGIGATGDADDETYSFYGAVTTPEYDLADGLKVSFGAAGLLGDSNSAASGSAKAAFETDEYSASVAADVNYDNEEFDADVAVAAAYDIVSLDVYYATRAMFDGSLTNNAIDNLFSAKAVVDLDPMTVTVTGLDLVNAQDLSASVAYAVNEELAVELGAGYVIDTEDMSVSADLTYTVDLYKAYVEADFGYNLDTEVDSLELVVGAESTTLVAGATLYGEWESGNLLDEGFGAITFGAEIAF